MEIEGETCCDFKRDTCHDLRWSAMLLETQNRREMVHISAACGRAYTGQPKEREIFRLDGFSNTAVTPLALEIEGETCCDFKRDTCHDLRWSAMLLETQNRREMVHISAACGRAYTGQPKEREIFRLDGFSNTAVTPLVN